MNGKTQIPTVAKKLSPADWNFESVPDHELVACCYWEYARESAFIRDVRQRSWEYWKPLYLKDQGSVVPDEKQLHEDLQKLQSIGYPSEVFMRGISCPPDGVLPDAPPLKPGETYRLTGSFPKPWMELSRQERAHRAQIGSDVDRMQLVPFKRGFSFYAKDIAEWVASRQRQSDAERNRVRLENPGKSEESLCREGKLRFPSIQPSLFWASGCEVTVVEIDWAYFNNNQISDYFRRWVKSNRPKKIKSPSGKGHKPNDWRANLKRLAVMRLLSCFRPSEILDGREKGLRSIRETKQFAGQKWFDITKWYEARREAGKLFRHLFPFLPANEKPLSWERRALGK